MNTLRLSCSLALVLLTCSAAFGEARCPETASAITYHALLYSHIAVPVTVNGSGPYEFMVDTGASMAILDPALATALELETAGSLQVATVTTMVEARRVIAATVAVGPISVQQFPLAVLDLGAVQAEYPKARGVLGNNFLARFDLLIDNRHHLLCLDPSRRMQQSLRGNRVPILSMPDAGPRSALAQLILLPVHLAGDGPQGSVLRLDSGVNLPLLYADRQPRTLSRPRLNPVFGGAMGKQGEFLCAWTPARRVRFGPHTEMEIAFLAPTRRPDSRRTEDGLLPTNLFHRVFISFAHHFVIFDPR